MMLAHQAAESKVPRCGKMDEDMNIVDKSSGYMQSTDFQLLSEGHRYNMEPMKPEPDPDGELYFTSSYGDNQLIHLKGVEESPLTRCPVLKTEIEDCMDLLELDPESCIKSEVMGIKFEEVMDIKEEEEPILTL